MYHVVYRAGNVAGFSVVVTVFCSSAVPSVTVILDNVVHRDAMANYLKSKKHTGMIRRRVSPQEHEETRNTSLRQ